MTCHPLVPAKSFGQSHILAALVRIPGVSVRQRADRRASALGALVCVAACASGEITPERGLDATPPVQDGSLAIDAAVDGSEIVGDDAAVDAMPGCQEDPATYSPFAGAGPYRSGTVTDFPWKGTASAYPDGDENFSNYGTAATTIECSFAKGAIPYLDVTAGCLSFQPVGSNTRGLIGAQADDAFRAIALAHPSNDPDNAVKWTDTGVEYRFYYSVTHGTANEPGFKAFLRYRTEEDLYVASWRRDGVAQIQKKQCGVYTPLVIDPNWGSPSLNAFHTLRFTAVGNHLQLFLDGKLAVEATDSTFAWGTAGIRIDAMDGAYIDDWRVFAP
jgi:hypothetical protein